MQIEDTSLRDQHNSSHNTRVNSITVLSLIQHISKFSKSLPLSTLAVIQNFGLFLGTALQDINRRFFFKIKPIEKYVLLIFAFLPFSFSQIFSYFIVG